jgi:hypothetical protein
MPRDEVHAFAVPAEDISKLGVADANGFRQHCFKHTLKVAWRA